MQRIFSDLRFTFMKLMKNLFFISFLVLLSTSAFAQKYDSWTFFHNRKEIGEFNLKKETDDERRVVVLNRTLEGPGFLVLEFTPKKSEADWIRNIAFVDSGGKTIREFKNTLLLRIHNTELANILEGREIVKVISWAVPKDPALAATEPVRRILLGTLSTL
jgi:hypothetical protein